MLRWKDIINFAVAGNPQPDRRVEKTDAEWKEKLTAEQFRITRKKGTEAPHSGALCSIHEAGKYSCVCCAPVSIFSAKDSLNCSEIFSELDFLF